MKVQVGSTEEGPLRPSQSAFVIQFRAETDVARRHYRGRVEHVASGLATSFCSWRELQVFVDRVLTEGAAPTEEG